VRRTIHAADDTFRGCRYSVPRHCPFARLHPARLFPNINGDGLTLPPQRLSNSGIPASPNGGYRVIVVSAFVDLSMEVFDEHQITNLVPLTVQNQPLIR
jgi:hypothetical protein